MGNENKFWLSLWTIIAMTFSILIVSITGYWIDHNAKIVELVNSGVDPVAAMCALQDDYGRNPVCLVLAAKLDKTIERGE